MLKNFTRSSLRSVRPVATVGVRSFSLASNNSRSNPRVSAECSQRVSHASAIFRGTSITFVPVRFAGNYPPHVVLNMPALSPTMETGSITEWTKKVGDFVKVGDNIAQVETDKATIGWDSTDEGYIAKFLVEGGATDVAVGQAVAVFAENKEDVEKFKDFEVGAKKAKKEPAKKEEPKEEAKETKKEESKPAKKDDSSAKETKKDDSAPKSAPKKGGSSGRIIASPLARALAEERGIDLSQVEGSGPGGRIVKSDIENFEQDGEQQQEEVQTQQAAPSAASGAAYTDINNSNIRKVTATRLTQSKQTIPHYYLTIEFNVDKLQKVREELNNRAQGKYKLSVNDFVIKASAMALRKVPEVNSSWNDKSIRRYHTVDINVAVNSDLGLFTPLVPNTDNKGLSEIANSVKALAEKAKSGKLSPDEMRSGTFTISNLGMFGIKSFSAVINPPQACILAVGGIEQRVIPSNDPAQPFKVANFMTCTLSCDHRVVDGALGATWLKEFRANMEDPLTMLL